MSYASLFDLHVGPIRFYLSRGAWGRPGLALRLDIRRFAIIIFAPYIETADLWVGVFHREVNFSAPLKGRDLWICLLPMLVFKVRLEWPERRSEGQP